MNWGRVRPGQRQSRGQGTKGKAGARMFKNDLVRQKAESLSGSHPKTKNYNPLTN